MGMTLILVIAIVAGGLYLICDAVQKYAALQELCRLLFAVAALAWCLTLK